MSGDNQSNTNSSSSHSPPLADMPRNRRASVTSAAFSNLFQRSNSASTGTPAFPGPITTAAINDQRRRLSISTMGLTGTSPTSGSAFGRRTGSMSTSSDSIDENAIDEDETFASARTAPNTPFTRRMSFGTQAALRTMQRSGGQTSPGNNGMPPMTRRASFVPGAPPTPPGSTSSSWKNPFFTQASKTATSRSASDMMSSARTDQGYNWSEQLRSRAESTVASGSRPSFSFASGMNNSPPRAGFGAGGGPPSPHHNRTKSVSDMPAPPAVAPKPRQDARPKPDAFQERILKGDFYMD